MTPLSLLALLSLFSTTLARTPSKGCGTTPKLVTPSSTTTPLRLTVNSKQREFYVKLPEAYNNTRPYRLILTLHALGGNAPSVISGNGGYLPYYGLPPQISSSDPAGVGAVFLVPNGLSGGWGNQGGEDVTFIRQAIATVEGDLCLDQDLRFSTGFSYGGAMSYTLACAMGKELRAVAALSGNPQISGTCAPGSEAVAYYGQHGTSDQVLPISGGRQMRDRFLRNNGCPSAQESPEPAKGAGARVKTVYQGCSKPVVWVAFDGPHTPAPKGNGEAQTWTPGETWNFFKQFT